MMPELVDEQAEATTSVETRLDTARLILRPFGYLLIGLVWLTIWLVAVALGPGIIAFIAIDGTMTFGELAENQSPASWIVAGVIVIPIAVMIWGPAVLWYLPCATWPLAVLSFLYALRSLRPAYASEKLSHSEEAPPGTSLGPPTVRGVSLSLQPVRRNRFTDLLMAFYMSGWDIDGKSFIAMLPAGVAFVLAFPALAIDMPAGVRAVCGALSVGLVLWSAVWNTRVFRERFWPTSPESIPRPEDG
jgi:hypothetical protein